MKKYFVRSICVILVAFCVLSVACSAANGYAESVNSVAYDENGSQTKITDEKFLSALSAFSAKIYRTSAEESSGNYVMSPLSVYMAFAMLHDIENAELKAETEEFLGMSAERLALTGDLFLSLLKTRKENDKTVCKLDITNSIWLNDDTTPNPVAADRLAKKFFCHAFKTPFLSNNKSANAAVRKFVKEKTNGLIDKNFDLPSSTLLAFINTLYLKDLWSLNGELDVFQGSFYAKDKVLQTEFLTGTYAAGEVASNQLCDFFFARTVNGYKLKFILPKDGQTIESVSTTANLEYVNGYKWNLADYDENSYCCTRCIFPAFNVTSDTDMKKILQSHGYLARAFSGFDTDLVDKEIFVSDVKHSATLNVDKTGVEGAAVTVIAGEATSVGPTVYYDFKVNRPFVFMLTTSDDVILFEGKIEDPTIKR
ncbi:MAG: hypothetical protein IJU83_01160 [Clostridia bacterium]|nr:hypothetical protein [Clostridia bacterium]